MGKRVMTAVSKMPNNDCPACHGFGSVRMTAHFHTEDREFEVACWECFGDDIKVTFPHPRSKDNG